MAKALQQGVQEIGDYVVRALEFTNRIDAVMALGKDIFTQNKLTQQCYEGLERLE